MTELEKLPFEEAIKKVSVYPIFTKCGKLKCSLVDTPHICEDDHGRIAFVSVEAKRKYLAARSAKERRYASRCERFK